MKLIIIAICAIIIITAYLILKERNNFYIRKGTKEIYHLVKVHKYKEGDIYELKSEENNTYFYPYDIFKEKFRKWNL